jgi:hypothetical protein
MKTIEREPQFICPECGGKVCIPVRLGDIQTRRNGRRRGRFCAHCHYEIPDHLSERWGGISVADARNEWAKVYRTVAALWLGRFDSSTPERVRPAEKRESAAVGTTA